MPDGENNFEFICMNMSHFFYMWQQAHVGAIHLRQTLDKSEVAVISRSL